MKVRTTETLPNGIGFSIIEVDEEKIKPLFKNRFLLVLEIEGKRIFPKDKEKFFKFESNSDIYNLKSDVTGDNVQVDEVLHQELLLCDKSFETCNFDLMSCIAMYNNKENLKRALKRIYNF